MRRAHLVTRSVAILAVLGVAVYFALFPGDAGFWAALFASLGALVFVLGPSGAVLEVVFGPVVSRLVFLAAGAVSLAGLVLKEPGNQAGPWGMAFIISSAGVLVMGGSAVLLLRLVSRPQRLMSLRAALIDVATGELDVFEQTDGFAGADPEAAVLEVLARSKLVYRVNERPASRLREARVVCIGIPPQATGAGTRRLSESELAELAAARPRMRRAAIASTLLLTWCSAIILRAAENWISRMLDPRLSGTGWVIACMVGVLFGISRFRRLRSIAVDLRNAVVTRSQESNPDGITTIEVLPASRQPWMLNGIPAAWRTGGT